MTAPLLSVELDHANTEELHVRAQAIAAMWYKLAAQAPTNEERVRRADSGDFWQSIAHRCVVTLRHALERAA